MATYLQILIEEWPKDWAVLMPQLLHRAGDFLHEKHCAKIQELVVERMHSRKGTEVTTEPKVIRYCGSNI